MRTLVAVIRFSGTHWLPDPCDAVVDQSGTIVDASRDYDGQGLRALIDSLLADPPPRPREDQPP